MGQAIKERMEIKPILPDTNVLIYALSGKEPYASFLREAIKQKKLVFSAIVIAEFLSGATDEEEKILLGLTQKLPVLSIDLTVAQIAAFYRKKYLHLKKKLVLPDCLIAATCKVYKAILVTLNKKDYPIKEIEIVDKF